MYYFYASLVPVIDFAMYRQPSDEGTSHQGFKLLRCRMARMTLPLPASPPLAPSPCPFVIYTLFFKIIYVISIIIYLQNLLMLTLLFLK